MKNIFLIPLSISMATSPLARCEVVVSYRATNEDLLLRLEAGDWSDHAETPTTLKASDSLTRQGGAGTLRFSGWGPAIDVDKRVGFQVTAKPGYRLHLSKLEHFDSGGVNQPANPLSSFVWGYRVDHDRDGVFEQNWVFGRTYTPADGDAFHESVIFKDWDFADFSTTGTVEIAIFASAATAAAQLHAFGDEIRLTGASATPVGALDAYTLGGSFNIPVSEASGLSYNRDTGTLFTVGDEGMEMAELSKTGVKLGAMPFDQDGPRAERALDDPEGVSYLGGGKFAIADERRNLAVVVTYDPATRPDLADLAPTSYAFGPYDGNTGLEGIAYDPVNQSLWGVKENGPTKIYEMTDFPAVRTGGEITVREPFPRKYITRTGNTQHSDIYVMAESSWFSATNPRRMNILLLAREFRRIYEFTRDGRIVGTLDLGFLGRNTIEGMTMDDEGRIYLVSEQVIGSFEPQLHVFNPGPAVPDHTPEEVLAFDTFSESLRDLDLVPSLVLPSLFGAISDIRNQGRADVMGNPQDYNLFTEDSIQDLRGTGVLVRAVGSEVRLSLPVERSTSLGTGSWSAAGFELEATFPKTGNKEFYRLAVPVGVPE